MKIKKQTFNFFQRSCQGNISHFDFFIFNIIIIILIPFCFSDLFQLPQIFVVVLVLVNNNTGSDTWGLYYEGR